MSSLHSCSCSSHFWEKFGRRLSRHVLSFYTVEKKSRYLARTIILGRNWSNLVLWFPGKKDLFLFSHPLARQTQLLCLGTCITFEGYYLLIKWVYILQTIFVHLPMYFHPNGNEMNSLLEGVSGFSFTNRQCLFIKVKIHSGLEGNVFDLMKFWKRKYLAGQILGFEKIIHFLTPSHYLFFLTVYPVSVIHH